MRTPSRFLAAAAAARAFAALPILGCGDAGDEVGDPTGATAQFTPGMDLVGSTLSARASGTVAQGSRFDILAEFRDGQNRPVEGMRLAAFDEEDSCFEFGTNPTLTNADGRASIPVRVNPTCLPGSYTITVATYPADPVGGPRVETFVHVSVASANVPAITSVSLVAETPSVTLPDNATFSVAVFATASCSLNVRYQAAGAGISVGTFTAVPGYPIFTLSPTSPGTLSVVVLAYCTETGISQGVLSDIVNVSVSGP